MAKSLVDQSHLQTANALLQRATDLQQWIDKAMKAGFPVQQIHDANQATIELARGFKREFFPDVE
jgi:hypothetical protein